MTEQTRKIPKRIDLKQIMEQYRKEEVYPVEEREDHSVIIIGDCKYHICNCTALGVSI